ncbi:unnamed protein product [Mucor circinelloides]
MQIIVDVFHRLNNSCWRERNMALFAFISFCYHNLTSRRGGGCRRRSRGKFRGSLVADTFTSSCYHEEKVIQSILNTVENQAAQTQLALQNVFVRCPWYHSLSALALQQRRK